MLCSRTVRGNWLILLTCLTKGKDYISAAVTTHECDNSTIKSTNLPYFLTEKHVNSLNTVFNISLEEINGGRKIQKERQTAR